MKITQGTRIARRSRRWPSNSKTSKPRYRRCKDRKVRAYTRLGDVQLEAIQMDFALEHISALLRDAFNTLPSYRSADYRKDLSTVRRRLLCEGMPFVTQGLPVLIQGLFDLLEGRPATYPSFRARDGAPVFLGGLFRVALTGNEAEKIYGLNYLYSIGVAFKKLKGPYKKSQLAKQFREFVQVDQELQDMDLFSEDRFPILEVARMLLARIVQDVSLDDRSCRPRPGPGATNTPVQKNLRYRPKVLYAQVERKFPAWDGWYTSHPWDFVTQSDIYRKLYMLVLDEPVSRFKFVPKTAGKARGICIEENEVQFLQQAVRRLLTNCISSDEFLSKRIALNDQRVNANLALKSSVDKGMSTIDMSEASDRVARDLVSWLFQDNKDLHDALMALSTKWIQPPAEADGRDLVRTNKFAPMGSALCFPVMSLVHYVLCRAIILLSDVADRIPKSRQVYVYGDDIIIPSDCYTAITDWLPRFGMKLNKTKSFVSSHFRESCGIHAFQGHDITPVYVKHVPYHQSISCLAALLAQERDLEQKGFTHTARLHRKRISMALGRILPEVPWDSPVIGFKRPSVSTCGSPLSTGAARKRRWSESLQCWEYQSSVLIDKTTVSRIPTDNQSLLKWLCVGGVDTREIEDSVSDECIIAHRWLPESAFGDKHERKKLVGITLYREYQTIPNALC